MYFRIDEQSTVLVRRFALLLVCLIACLFVALVSLGAFATQRETIHTVGVLKHHKTFVVRSASEGVIGLVRHEPNSQCSAGDTLVTYGLPALLIDKDRLQLQRAALQRGLADLNMHYQNDKREHELHIEQCRIDLEEAELSLHYYQRLYDIAAPANGHHLDSAILCPPKPMDLKYAELAVKRAHNSYNHANADSSHVIEHVNSTKAIQLQMDIAERDLATIDRKISECSITAPIDGYVYYDQSAIAEGQWISKGQAICLIVSQAALQMSCLLQQRDIVRCVNGQEALIVFKDIDDNDRREYKGVVSELYLEPHEMHGDGISGPAMGNFPMYQVVISIDSSTKQDSVLWHAGMTADVFIFVGANSLMSNIVDRIANRADRAIRGVFSLR